MGSYLSFVGMWSPLSSVGNADDNHQSRANSIESPIKTWRRGWGRRAEPLSDIEKGWMGALLVCASVMGTHPTRAGGKGKCEANSRHSGRPLQTIFAVEGAEDGVVLEVLALWFCDLAITALNARARGRRGNQMFGPSLAPSLRCQQPLTFDIIIEAVAARKARPRSKAAALQRLRSHSSHPWAAPPMSFFFHDPAKPRLLLRACRVLPWYY